MSQDVIDNNLLNEKESQKYGKQNLPNATGVLVLGILSITLCWCYGLPGIVLGIIALVMAKKPLSMYKENPDIYEGYQNLRAGRITAIIGLILSGLFIIFLIVYFVFIFKVIEDPTIFDRYFPGTF